MDTSKLNFGERLKNLRERRGITQGQLAAKAGISRSVIASAETRGYKRPGSETLLKLAKALGITAEELLGETQPKVESPDDILERYRLAAPVSVPVYDHFVVRAGPAVEVPVDYVYRPRAQAVPGNIEGYHVHGSCMEPEVTDGSVVIVDRDRPPQVGNIILCLMNDEVLIGRIVDRDGELMLHNGHGDHRLNECQAHAVVIEVTKRLV